MKIAVFFIIVAINSCFVDADQVPKMECKLKMNRSQAENIGAQVAQLLKLRVRMKDSRNIILPFRFLQQSIYIMDVMAIVTGCPSQVIARLMVTYLPSPWKPHTAEIEDALWKRNCTALNSMNFSEDDMTATLMKAADALLFAQDHNSEEVLKKGVMSLAATSTAQEMNKIIRSMPELINITDLKILRITGLDPILRFGNSAVEIGGALKPADNMDDPLGNLSVRKLPEVIGGGAGGH